MLERTPAGTVPGEDPTDLQVVRTPVTVTGLEAMAERMFGNLVKAVVDVERGIMAVGGEMHADEEALLLSEGSLQSSLWGINPIRRSSAAPGSSNSTRSSTSARGRATARGRWMTPPRARPSSPSSSGW